MMTSALLALRVGGVYVCGRAGGKDAAATNSRATMGEKKERLDVLVP